MKGEVIPGRSGVMARHKRQESKKWVQATVSQRTSHGKGGEDANGGSYAWKSRLGQTEDIKAYTSYCW